MICTGIRTYVVNHDVGFAPNPYFKFCTLACCRADIRLSARKGEYLLGFGSSTVQLERRLVYFMRVEEKLDMDDYSTDDRFVGKTPRYDGAKYLEYGDRAYRRDDRELPWTQLPSFHSRRDGSPNQESIDRDTRAPVLVSREYCYWGRSAILVPPHLHWLPVEGRKPGKRLFTAPDEIQMVIDWLTSIPQRDVRGEPAHWDEKLLRKKRAARSAPPQGNGLAANTL